jgi:NAD-dependent deacetylase
MLEADKIVFMGTSFSVNITQMALDVARYQGTPIVVVDPQPVSLIGVDVEYKAMKASEYLELD